MEVFSLVHFGINTFTSKEWGFGDESPMLFNPTALDANQWARTCVESGLKGIILVCKHHDGFCLWPTRTTEHCVRNSPWKNGQGDVVGEVANSCRRHGLKFGVYLSPWDRNHAEYGRPAYVEVYHRQLRELLTGYGPLFEVWFDGANGGDGYYGGARDRRSIEAATYYQWDIIEELVREFQPEACMFGYADIRFVGNELGVADETCWATTSGRGIDVSEKGRPETGVRDGKFWMPAECDFPLRKGWFFHEGDDVRSPIKLAEIYFQSVGRGGAMNIGLAPDKRGLLHEDDVKALRDWGDLIRETFQDDLLKSKEVRIETNIMIAGDRASEENGLRMLEGDLDLPHFIGEFHERTKFNVVELREYLPLGQRIESFAIDIWADDAWTEVSTATSVGSKRLLMIPQAETSKFRIRITQADVWPALAKVGLYRAPLKMVLGGDLKIMRDKAGYVAISCTNDGLSIRYTTDGSEPHSASAFYRKPFLLKDGGTVKAFAFVPGEGEPRTSTLVQTFGCDRSGWSVIRVSLESPFENNGAAGASKMLDDDPSTYWHTYHQDKSMSAPPHEVVLDMGKVSKVKGFTLMPFDGPPDGTPDKYEFYISDDCVRWQLAAAGEFSNIKVSPGMRTIPLDQPLSGRYFRFVATHVVDDGDYVVIAGLGAIMADL